MTGVKYKAFRGEFDTIYGTSIEEAISAYCAELGYGVEDYEPADTFKEIPGDKVLTITDYGTDKKETKTVAEWITQRLSETPLSRMICSTEF